jgi:hypothetical protein
MPQPERLKHLRHALLDYFYDRFHRPDGIRDYRSRKQSGEIVSEGVEHSRVESAGLNRRQRTARILWEVAEGQ